jgi:FixJ family two-component response regulator
MKDTAPIVFVVDDDASVRKSVGKLIASVGLRSQTFASTQEFLGSKRPQGPACLILDVRLPDMSGMEFQRQLAEADIRIPIIFITGYGDIPMTVRAMKAGAVEFLTKPFRGQELLEAVQEAIARDRVSWSHRARLAELTARHESLTAREKEVMSLVVLGLLNKQIAAELGTSELTIKTHRGRVMEKMGADSVADLVRMSEALKPTAPKPIPDT